MDIPEGQGDFTILPLPTLSSDFLWQLRPLNFFLSHWANEDLPYNPPT